MPEPFPLIDRPPVSTKGINIELWRFLGRLEAAFPGGWVLVGGQMVLLHGLESGVLPERETVDADALVNVRVIPDGIAHLSLPRPSRHGGDLAFLLGLVRDIARLDAAMTASDRRWLKLAGSLLDNELVWRSAADPDAARAALRYLLRKDGQAAAEEGEVMTTNGPAVDDSRVGGGRHDDDRSPS